MKSLGEWMCLDGENSSRVHDAFDKAQPLKLSAVMAREPRLIKVSPARPDKTRILDLSIHELGSRTSIGHLIDLIVDHEGPLEIAGITTKMSNNYYGQLPEIIRPNRNFGHRQR